MIGRRRAVGAKLMGHDGACPSSLIIADVDRGTDFHVIVE
jgi:hypothetical protein